MGEKRGEGGETLSEANKGQKMQFLPPPRESRDRDGFLWRKNMHETLVRWKYNFLEPLETVNFVHYSLHLWAILLFHAALA